MRRFGEAAFGKAMKDKAMADGALREAGHGVTYAVQTGARGHMEVAVWAGKASKPRSYYRVRDDAEAMRIVEKVVDAEKGRAEYKAERAAAKKSQMAEMAEKITVGTLIVNSWGYDQTNVDFYEVVARRGASVTLRKIAGEQVEQTGWASAKVRACPGEFIGPEFKKRIGPYGVSFRHGGGFLTTAEKTHYSSWYA